jgi:hypothetical protein
MRKTGAISLFSFLLSLALLFSGVSLKVHERRHLPVGNHDRFSCKGTAERATIADKKIKKHKVRYRKSEERYHLSSIEFTVTDSPVFFLKEEFFNEFSIRLAGINSAFYLRGPPALV